MSDLTTYELDGRIATITMDDGKVNAFSIPMLQALHAAFDRAEQDERGGGADRSRGLLLGGLRSQGVRRAATSSA